MSGHDEPPAPTPADAPVARPDAGADEPLPGSVRVALLLDGADAPLEPARRARIRERVWSRVGAAAGESPAGAARPGRPARARPMRQSTVVRDVLGGPWTQLFDGCEMRELSDDGFDRTWLIRLAPGRALPPHDHRAAAEQCLIVAGEALVGTTRFRAGDFHVALRGSFHADVRTDVGCVLLLRSPSPAREHAAG
jgi:hypothetical protein